MDSILKRNVISHELIHFIESNNSKLLKKSIDFVIKRNGNKQPRLLKDIYPNVWYRADERSYEDEYIEKGGSAYSGKEYKHNGKWFATDVLSMGIQRLIENPLKFYETDKEYFEFTIKQLRGLLW